MDPDLFNGLALILAVGPAKVGSVGAVRAGLRRLLSRRTPADAPAA